jgi:hypothetical protein
MPKYHVRRSVLLAAGLVAAAVVVVVPVAQAAERYQFRHAEATVAGDSVTATVEIRKGNGSATLGKAGICARSASGEIVDFPFQQNVRMGTSWVTVTNTRSFAAGTYRFGGCVQRQDGTWPGVTGTYGSFVVESGTPSDSPPGSALSVSTGPTTAASPPAAPPLRGTYYVSATGSDTNAGTSPDAPWRTIGKVNGTSVAAGQVVLFRRGDTFTDAGIVADHDGVTYGGYGGGSLPIIDGGGTDTRAGSRTPIRVAANRVTITGLQVQHAQYAGIDIFGSDTRVEESLLTHNAAGVQQDREAGRVVITRNEFVANTVLVIGPGKDDDYGAQGVAIGGTGAEVSHNTFRDHWASGSPDYGVDGAAIEVFGARDAVIHHNTSVNDLIFSELGDDLTDNVLFDHNLMYSTRAAAAGINIHGSGTFGGVTRTRVLHNSVVLTASDSIAFDSSNADAEVKNNIFSAAGVHCPTPVDEAGNVWEIRSYHGMNSLNAPNGSGYAKSSTTGPAGFVSPETGDFHITASSAAIDRSVSASVKFTSDFVQGGQRGAAWDAGAYEYAGG